MMVLFQKRSSLLLLFFVSVLLYSDPSALAFVPLSFSSSLSSSSRRSSSTGGGSGIASSSSNSPTTTNNDDFASFAASFGDDDDDVDDDLLKKKKKNGSSSSSSNKSSSKSSTTTTRSWKEDLEDLLDPTTPMAKRQSLLTDLLSANQDIRQAVQTALREQKIDPLLTPRGKRIQDGTRAVARQLTVDILPTFASTDVSSSSTSSSSSRERSSEKQSSSGSSSSSSNRKKETTSSSSRLPIGIPVPPLPPLPSLRPPKLDFLVPPSSTAEELTKMGRNVWNALQRQVQNNLATLQDDLADPTTRIPKRVQQQTQSFLQQATNVFAETPVNLSEPPYTIYQATADYEIRDYSSYTVASTNMVPVGQDDLYDSVLQDNPGRTLAAFNTLAAYYLLGANQQQRPISNTGCFPVVTTTMLGEMRFYIDTDKFGTPPEPLQQHDDDDEVATTTTTRTSKSNSNSNSDFVYETGAIFLEQIPPARLAVRRFTGFCTAGEVARQKQALLAALDLDCVELDVPHGGTVPHVVFQYNPPYALPVVRRNEIAVAVLDQSMTVEEASLRKITQLKRQQEMDNNNTGNDDDDNKPVGAATATTATFSKSTSSTSKGADSSSAPTSNTATKINGSNDPVIFPDDDPWGENA